MKKSLILIARSAIAITLAVCSPPAESDSATTPAATAPAATAESSTTVTRRGRHADHDRRRRPDLQGDAQRQPGGPGLRGDAPVTLPGSATRESSSSPNSTPHSLSPTLLHGVQPGDLVYHNPRDSVTIIYAETSSVPTLTKMGQITSGLTRSTSFPTAWTST